jgi:hypothetical protein
MLKKVDRLCGLVSRVPGYTTEMYCASCEVRTEFIYVYVEETRPPLWSSSQSSWLQIQRCGFDSLLYQIFREVVSLERGPLCLMSTTEELLERKVAAPVEKTENTTVVIPHMTISISKRWHYLRRQAAVARSV